jgi:DNA-binding MarR family transcriptional regulator
MEDPRPIEFATPTLMRAARGVYARSIRAQLHNIGVDDLPRNGAFILAGIDSPGAPRDRLAAELGATGAAASQVIDTLVSRGLLQRDPNPDDGARSALVLTEDGRKVLDAVICGVEAVDRRLAERVSGEQIEAMRAALLALTSIKIADVSTGPGRRRPTRLLRQFSPIFPVRELAPALAHYAALGFETIAYDDGSEYGFANRDGVGLHLAADPDHDPAHPGSTYLYVHDADALAREWSRPGIGGHTSPVAPTPYKLREGSHTDPDGNLIRFGSAMDADPP